MPYCLGQIDNVFPNNFRAGESVDFLNTALSGVFAGVFAGEFASLQPWAKASIGLALVALVAVVAGIVARIVLLKVVRRGR